MKSKNVLLALFVFLLLNDCANAQTVPAIIDDWTDYAGISDTLTAIPVAKDDSNHVISVGTTIDTATFADILTTKYDTGGSVIWQRTYSSAGYNRDQPVAVAVDDRDNIYVCGSVFSTATNFDIVVLKYKYDGTFVWAYTLNGSANSYDVPAAIKTKGNFVYVTGEVSDTNSLLNYVTFQLDRNTGALNWKHEYDYHNLYDVAFAMDISPGGNSITVSGASQDTPIKWNYCSIKYDSMGTAQDTTRIAGAANSFDRPTAVKSDHSGNFYVTGAASDSGASFNVRTAKIDSAGNLAWVVDYGASGVDDEANDVLVDDSGYVYVGGKSYAGPATKEDYLLVKYSNSGVQKWYRRFDASSSDDEAVKMCFDNYGNIVMTGSAIRSGKKDILTLAYNRTGDLQWKTYLNGAYNGDDRGTGIVCDANGNIYVTGQVQNTDSTWQQVTIKYKTDYFLVPQDTVPAPSSLLFYPNHGQIIDTNDSLRNDVFFYTINQYPKLYFQKDSIDFVFAKVDNDTATTDTLERIAMTFVDGDIHKAPYTDVTHDTDQVLNYFLGQCPAGITGVTGSEKLMYSKVYSKTDVIFANNNAGMKFQIIINNGGEPGKVKLHFTGHHLLSIVNSSDLKIDGALGSFTYERPLVYQLDGMGNRVSLGWLASYNIIDSADVVFALGGPYNALLPLVFECARAVLPTSNSAQGNLDWSSWCGGTGTEDFVDALTDYAHNKIVVGNELGNNFPLQTSITPFQGSNAGDDDAVIVKFNYLGQKKWATYVGGSGEDFGQGVTIDSDHHIYIVGHTRSQDFPHHDYNTASTSDFYQDQIAGTTSPWDGFIFELGEDVGFGTQTEIWGTYFGGAAGRDWFEKTKIDGSDNLFIVGNTNSVDFPVPASQPGGAYFQPCADYSTLSCTTVSGSTTVTTTSTAGIIIGSFVIGNGIPTGATVVSTAGTTFVISIAATVSATSPLTFSDGYDGVMVKFDSDHILKWSTCYGGNSYDATTNLDIDQSGNVFVIGLTQSSNLPTYDPNSTNDYFDNVLNGNSDAFILKFSNNGTRGYATYYGGNGDERGGSQWIGLPYNDYGGVGGSIIVTSSGDFYLTGSTTSTDNAWLHSPGGNTYYQGSNGGNSDVWIAEFNSGLSRIWGTYYGGDGYEFGNDICVDNAGIIYVTGTAAYQSTLMPFPSAPPGTYTHAPSGFLDCFITAFTRWGTNIWGTYFGGSSNLFVNGDKGVCMTYDQSPYLNQVVVYGYTESNDYIHEDPGNGVYMQSSMLGAYDASLTRFTTDVLHAISINVNDISSKENSLSIFPNPANNACDILFENKVAAPLSIVLFNFLGEEVKKVNLGRQIGTVHYQLDISGLPVGIYQILVMGKDESWSNKLAKY